jgi:hypothetical protein
MGMPMFSTAVSTFSQVKCFVGWNSKQDGIKFSGSGCILTPDVAVTALHTLRPIPFPGASPILNKHDGIYHGTIEVAAEDEDIAVIRIGARITGLQKNHQAPKSYPLLPTAPPAIGMSVGYLARITFTDGTGAPYFAPAALSAMVPLDPPYKGSAPPLRCMLSDGIIQSGFSGSAVFSPDGVIHGVLTHHFRFSVSAAGEKPRFHSRALMTPLSAVLAEVKRLIQGWAGKSVAQHSPKAASLSGRSRLRSIRGQLAHREGQIR